MSVIGKHVRTAWRPAVALVLAAGLAVPTWSASGTQAQSELPQSAAAAPESTVFFHEIDLDLEGAQWQQTEALLARVGFPDVLGLWREEVLKEGADTGGLTEADLDALLGGEMAVIVTADAVPKLLAMHQKQMEMMAGHDGEMAMVATPEASATGDEAFGLAAVLVPSDADAAWAYAQRQIEALATQEDVQVEQSEYGDTEIIAVELPKMSDDMAMGDDPYGEMFGHHGGFVAARDGGFIIAAATQADVTGIVDVLNGDVPSLAEAASAQAVAAQLPADALSLTYLDGQAIIDQLDPEMLASLQSLMPEMPQESWGGAVGIAISAADPGFRLDAFAKFPEGTDLATLGVANDRAIVASAERVPEGTFLFEAGTVPPSAWAGLPFTFSQMVNAATGDSQWNGDEPMMALPSPEEMEAEITKATESLGFNPATDLFSLLGTEFIVFSSFPSFSMEGFGLNAVAAVSTTDPAALAETSRKVADWIKTTAPDASVTVRKQGGDTLYVLSDPETKEVPAIEFGVVGDQAVVAVGNGIDELLNTPAASLADDSQYQTVMAELPADFYQVVYVDISKAITPIMMLTGEFGDASQISDADLACTDYADQAAAQAAYDADPVANSNLDLDFDGQACEDAYSAAGATSATAQGSLENLRALGMVSYQQDDGAGSSAILYIAEPGS